jgi:hypothetical protein
MSPRSARHTILSEIAPFEKEDDELRIIIETRKGSRNKYSYDPECDCQGTTRCPLSANSGSGVMSALTQQVRPAPLWSPKPAALAPLNKRSSST